MMPFTHTAKVAEQGNGSSLRGHAKPDADGGAMLDILLHRVSMRSYIQVIPQMAETAGVSRSAVLRWLSHYYNTPSE